MRHIMRFGFLMALACVITPGLSCTPRPESRHRPQPAPQPQSAAEKPTLVEVRDGYGGYTLRWLLPGQAVLITDHDSPLNRGTSPLYCPYEGGAVLTCERRADAVHINGKPAGVDLRSGAPSSLRQLQQLGPEGRVLIWENPRTFDPAIIEAIVRQDVPRTILSLVDVEAEDLALLPIHAMGRHIQGLVLHGSRLVQPSHLSGFTGLRTLLLKGVTAGTSLAELSRFGRLEVLELEHLDASDLNALTPLARLGELRLLSIHNARFESNSLDYLGRLSRLRGLTLSRCHLGTTAMESIGRLTGLQLLNLERNNISNTNLKHLRSLTALSVLNLGWTGHTQLGLSSHRWSGFSDEALAVVGGMPTLRGLSLAVNRRVTDAGLGHLASLVHLEDLDLAGTNISDEGLRHLAVLPRLRQLALVGTKVRGPGLRHLVSMRRLEALHLGGKMNREALRHLPTLPKLRRLSVESEDVLEADLGHLARQSRLSWLKIEVRQLRGTGLSSLGRLPLEYLAVLRSEVTAEGLAVIASFQGLRTLIVDSYSGSPEGLAVLARLKNLERLVIAGDIADEALIHLKGLSRLRSLEIISTRVRGPGLGHLGSLPHLRALYLESPNVSPFPIEDPQAFPALRELVLGGSSYRPPSTLSKERPEILIRRR